MEIRKLQEEDLQQALELVWEVFREFEAPEYSEEGINEFKSFIAYNSIIEQFNKKELYFWGCVDNSEIIGVIATRGINHICLLFVKKEHHRQGIARRLFRKVEERCNDSKDIKKITVNSSPFAIEVYHRLGFIDTDKEQVINGIRFTPMVYKLTE